MARSATTAGPLAALHGNARPAIVGSIGCHDFAHVWHLRHNETTQIATWPINLMRSAGKVMVGQELRKNVMANVVGWIAVIFVTAFAAFWSFWGTIEAFHEGWSKPYLWMRLLQLAGYLSLGTSLCVLCVIGIRWPKIGAGLFVLVGALVAALIVVDQALIHGFVLFSITGVPMLVGFLFLFGRPEPKTAAYAVAITLPVLTILICGFEPVIRVSNRYDDGNRNTRLVEGNGVRLLWAPAGPGWTREGNLTWHAAVERVRYLSDDGLSLLEEPQDIWRLPTRREVVCSLTRGNLNAGGRWNEALETATYNRKPDKESPLWDRYAPLIYLWTSEEHSEQLAWIVVYHGGTFTKSKNLGASSLGIRAVRELH